MDKKTVQKARMKKIAQLKETVRKLPTVLNYVSPMRTVRSGVLVMQATDLALMGLGIKLCDGAFALFKNMLFQLY